MDAIKQIFNGDFGIKRNQIIDNVNVNRVEHTNGILNILMFYEPEYIVNQRTRPILKQLFDYFTGNPESELDLSKGIAIFGGVGTGKTLLMKVFKEYTMNIIYKNSFIFKTAAEIVDSINVSGVEVLSNINFIQNKATTLYIDDLCAKNEEVNHFGTKINAMENLLSQRYEIFKQYKRLTHITSNKYPVELSKIYGERIVDRMAEMFNIIELTGESFRK